MKRAKKGQKTFMDLHQPSVASISDVVKSGELHAILAVLPGFAFCFSSVFFSSLFSLVPRSLSAFAATP